MAHPARVELDGGDAGGLLDLDGVDIAVDVRLHDGHAHLVLDALERTDERGGLPRAGGGHHVELLVTHVIVKVVQDSLLVAPPGPVEMQYPVLRLCHTIQFVK